ncbi:tetratricopeptide repeat protein [Christiangramia echinicola]|uniref:Tetratricopeptide repeat-containing protein n=1 Tax=Christiangramia echinicola TaxID=279359 RepID=A0A1H1N480_9FLAO|nr:hypothetical protein [Christiangramia echinicola]SDR93941.1 hypothetical protein SAMN04488552_1581 [Christiangramia echinicola]
MKINIFLLLMSVLMISCDQESDKKVTAPEDYNEYLAVKESRTTSPYFELWNSKITKDSLELPSFAAVAGQYNTFFESTGDIAYLKKAEQSLLKAVEIANIDKDKYYRSLSRNYISQHRFKEARIYADSAAMLGKDLTVNQHLLFDVHMELGNYKKADSLQKLFADPYDFNYMIRAAKWNDFEGDLDRTIMFMEKARDKAEESKNRSLLLWVYSNLGDYYGHAGRIEDSYYHYLKTLKIDPSNSYAKKGIAWIVFSHENNKTEALRIIDSILESHTTPDLYLLKAEIAEHSDDNELYEASLSKYKNLTQKPAYGEMYNAYNLKVYLGEKGKEIDALDLARKEVANRETPETYQLLALAHLKNGNKKEALKIVKDKVEGKTYEPEAQLALANIYKANNLTSEAKKIKKELLEARFELGPVTYKEVMDL